MILGKEKNIESELWFKAEMTHRQFLALSHKLSNSDIENEIINIEYFKYNLKRSKNAQNIEIEKLLNNSWNTENILISNQAIIDNSGQSFALQWAFPQAYYSIFSSLLAYYKTAGYTESSHTAVLKKFGSLVLEDKLPYSISFHTNGAKKKLTYNKINKQNGLKSIDLDLSNNESIENQICQFLKSTREIKLNEKAPEIIKNLKLKTKNGQPKKNLSVFEWAKVSNSISITTIMDLLYRKRIKSNYMEIDVFTYEKLKGKDILDSLCTIVDRLNLVNEAYILKAIGEKDFEYIKNKYTTKVSNIKLDNRFKIIQSLGNA